MHDTEDTTTPDDTARIAALAQDLGYEPDAYEPAAWGDNTFTDGGAEYRVLTDTEADEAVAEYIADSLWAFNSDFLAGFTGLPVEVFAALSDKCEDANEPIRKIVDATGDFDELVDEAVQSDGRGHFLAGYDGAELELSGNLYAYRTN